ncbi:MAG TPA: plastocyanin/azurin family copper-binding protein [Chloroflexota bacterium]|jgi:plastocyanin
MSGFRPVGVYSGVRAVGVALALFLLVPGTSAFAQGADAPVDVKNFVFAPIEIHIAPGQTVTWTNQDAIQHTITADDGSFDSGFLDQGATFTQEFDVPGAYQYFCQPHGGPGLTGMAATVIVDG